MLSWAWHECGQRRPLGRGREEPEGSQGPECFVLAVRRPQRGLLCKLQWPFTAGVRQNCFLYVPKMFMRLFSLAGTGRSS